MNALHIAKLDLLEKRMVLMAAGIVGLLLLATPLLPGMGGPRAGDLRGAAALSLGGTFMFIMALIQGATMLATDLQERRLGFYFNQPLSASALWGGKVLGGGLLLLAIGVLTLTPSLLAAAAGRTNAWSEFSLAFGGFWGLCMGGMFLAHVLSVTARARTIWLLVVVGLLGFWGWALRQALYRLLLFSAEGFPDLVTALGIAFVTLALALAISGWIQVTLGRTDLRRSARVTALALVAGVLGSLACLQGFAMVRTRIDPAELVAIGGAPAPQGDWITLSGSLDPRSSHRLMLFNPVTGTSVVPDRGVQAISFSADGRRAAWIQTNPGLKRESGEVVWVDLTLPQPKPNTTGILVEDYSYTESLQLSKDGRRFVHFGITGRLEVHDLESGLLLASARIEGSGHGECVFLDADRVRFYKQNGDHLDLGELDLRTSRTIRTGQLRDMKPKWWGMTTYNPATDRMLVRLKSGETLLCDARTGHIFATFPLNKQGLESAPKFLWDGSVVEGMVAGNTPQLRVLDDAGQPRQTFDLRAALRPDQTVKYVSMTAQLSAAQLLIRVRSKDEKDWKYQMVKLDLTTGHVAPLDHGIPMSYGHRFGENDRPNPKGPLFRQGQNLVQLQADGSIKVLLRFKNKVEAL